MPGQTVDKKGGRTGYRKLDAKRDRISFRLPDSLAAPLEKHRFPEEDTQSFINRMVKRAIESSEDCDTLCRSAEFTGQKVNFYSFRAEPVVSDYLNRLPGRSTQEKVECALSCSAALHHVTQVSSPVEALVAIKLSGLQGRVEVSQAIEVLVERCADSVARRLIKSLADQGLITLIQVSSNSQVERINIGGTQYGYLELSSSLASLS
jgi:hypothetical protein